MNYLNFAYGNVWLVVFPMFAGIVLIADNLRKSDKKNVMTILTLIMFIILSISFLAVTNRSEDTARYTLIWVPVISIIAANYLDEIYLFISNYQKYLALVVILIVICLLFYNATLKIVEMRQVKESFPTSFFEACDWIKENTPEDSLISTVWTHRTSYSCQRRVAGSSADMALSNNVSHILSTANEFGITHIFIQKFSLSNEALSEKYPISYVQLLDENTDYFEKIFENGPSLDQCIQQGSCDGNIVYRIIKYE